MTPRLHTGGAASHGGDYLVSTRSLVLPTETAEDEPQWAPWKWRQLGRYVWRLFTLLKAELIKSQLSYLYYVGHKSWTVFLYLFYMSWYLRGLFNTHCDISKADCALDVLNVRSKIGYSLLTYPQNDVTNFRQMCLRWRFNERDHYYKP